MNRTIGLISANYNIAGYGELCDHRPPAAIPFGGRYRLMDFALSNLVNSHITTVGLITPYYYRSIMDHISSGKPWGLDRKDGGLFILPGTVFGPKDDNRLLLRDIAHNRNFLLRANGDYVLCSGSTLVCNIDFQPMIESHELNGYPVTLLYKKMPSGNNKPGYYLDINSKGFVEKIAKGNQGENFFLDSFIIDKSFLLQLIDNYSALGYADLMDILIEALPKTKIQTYEFTGYVGFTEDLQQYMQTSMDLLKTEVRAELFRGNNTILTKVHDTPPAFYVPGSDVKMSVITAGSVIKGKVEHSILFRNVKIAKNVSVKNCVLMQGCVVEEGAQLENVIVDKHCTITAGKVIRGTAESPVVLPRNQRV